MNALVEFAPLIDARLPAAYEAAKTALAECSRLDECQDWADKAAALASYAKQADDDSLYKMAVRIEAWAYRRCGQLLNEQQELEKERIQQWIAAARREFKPEDRQHCRVCGKYKNLTHAHHITPLFVQYRRGYLQPDHDYVWLCPTHHTAVHVLISQAESQKGSEQRDQAIANVMEDLPWSEWSIVVDLYLRSLGIEERICKLTRCAKRNHPEPPP